MKPSGVIVCSFYTADDYYRDHADSLRKNLESLSLEYELEEIETSEGEDWADICRKKIAFLNRVCEDNPGARVYWIDVDCKLTAMPDFVQGFTADIIGFQRGFGNPLTIGYEKRTRFWEPCFFGINATPAARKFMKDAAELEQTLDIKATDDYFFEESWRANAADMSFQIIPSASAVRGEPNASPLIQPFFIFGASGNVDIFKGKVVQHGQLGSSGGSWARKVRRRALGAAKGVERRLPDSVAHPLRRASDTIGVTGALVGTEEAGTSRARQALINVMLRQAHDGHVLQMDQTIVKLRAMGVLNSKEEAAIEAAQSFGFYAAKSAHPISTIWWARPFPGNFGDWLSPLILAHYSDKGVKFQAPAAMATKKHIVSVGSIGRFIKPNSIVVGTGISSTDLKLAGKAQYVSVRGPITAEVVKASGGPEVTTFGDPGVLLSRVFPLERRETNGRLALVRHFTHGAIPAKLPEDMDELSVMMSSSDRIREFAETLIQYDGVVTSAMHVMILCHSYGIPCFLITFEGFEATVHGTGIKYEDYARGAGLSTIYNPESIPTDLSLTDLRGNLSTEKISEDKLDEVESAIKQAVALYSGRSARV